MSPTIPKQDVFLDVCELFCSIAGETTHAGRAAFFIRLSGCNLCCSWCDTEKAMQAGRKRSIGEILTIVEQHPQYLVIVTGGEPLLQTGTSVLCAELIEMGREVMVETNGSMDISFLPCDVHVVLDIKTPGSGQSERMDFENLERLQKGDELKMVVGDRADFDWAMEIVQRYPALSEVPVVFSPVYRRLHPEELAAWVIQSGRKVRIQLQLHKLIWPQGEPVDDLLGPVCSSSTSEVCRDA